MSVKSQGRSVTGSTQKQKRDPHVSQTTIPFSLPFRKKMGYFPNNASSSVGCLIGLESWDADELPAFEFAAARSAAQIPSSGTSALGIIGIGTKDACQMLPALQESVFHEVKTDVVETQIPKKNQGILIPQKYWDHLYEMAFLAAGSNPFD